MGGLGVLGLGASGLEIGTGVSVAPLTCYDPYAACLPVLSLPCLQRVRAAVEAQAATEGAEGLQQPAGPLEDDPTYK